MILFWALCLELGDLCFDCVDLPNLRTTRSKLKNQSSKLVAFVLKNQMKAERNTPRTHFEAHFSRGWRRSRLSQSGPSVIIQKAPAFIPNKWHRLQSVLVQSTSNIE
jgi:hypothetical protein